MTLWVAASSPGTPQPDISPPERPSEQGPKLYLQQRFEKAKDFNLTLASYKLGKQEIIIRDIAKRVGSSYKAAHIPAHA